MVVEIPLTQGKAALVDDVFAKIVGRYKWYAQRRGDGRCWTADRRQGKIKMHRYIMSLHLGRFLTSSEVIDHVNHDSLDNRIENLRLATQRQNCMNQRVRVGPKSSKYKGVYWDETYQKWFVDIDRKDLKYRKSFEEEIDAGAEADHQAAEVVTV